ncbi:hypothetical protein DF19_08650 [Streptomyces olindensis]|nr:hypothetical protein DF19_18590 [Streptomyces olindensis]KDN77654.1 hypothetical protein DF19_08650 [Streptomyces olindensis]
MVAGRRKLDRHELAERNQVAFDRHRDDHLAAEEPVVLHGTLERGEPTLGLDDGDIGAVIDEPTDQPADILAGELGLDLRGVVIDRDAHDAYGEWSRRAEIGEEGALLVRPDGYVAWRTPDGATAITEATDLLRQALTAVLCRAA